MTVTAIHAGLECGLFCGKIKGLDCVSLGPDMFDIHFVRNVIQYKTQVRAIYKGSNGIYISVFIKSLDGALIDIREQYEEIYKDCCAYKLDWHEGILEKLDRLKALAEKYFSEKKRLESLSINEIEL